MCILTPVLILIVAHIHLFIFIKLIILAQGVKITVCNVIGREIGLKLR